MTKDMEEQIKELPEQIERHLIANKARCGICHDTIRSNSIHDYVRCRCTAIAVDGGTDYLRRIGERSNIEELSVYSNDEFEKVRAEFQRGTYGESGQERFHYIKLKDMTDEHIQAVLDINPPKWQKIIYLRELIYREENK